MKLVCKIGILGLALLAGKTALAANGARILETPVVPDVRPATGGQSVETRPALDSLRLMIVLHQNGARDWGIRSVAPLADRACCATGGAGK